jgi:hypothetical protein
MIPASRAEVDFRGKPNFAYFVRPKTSIRFGFKQWRCHERFAPSGAEKSRFSSGFNLLKSENSVFIPKIRKPEWLRIL